MLPLCFGFCFDAWPYPGSPKLLGTSSRISGEADTRSHQTRRQDMSERCSLIPLDLKAAAAAASTKMAGRACLSLTPQRCLSWSDRNGAYCFDFVARGRRAGAGLTQGELRRGAFHGCGSCDSERTQACYQRVAAGPARSAPRRFPGPAVMTGSWRSRPQDFAM